MYQKHKEKFRIFCLLMLIASTNVTLAEEAATTSTLSVKAEGLENKTGDVVFCLWREKDAGFPRCDKGDTFKKVTVKAESPVAIFENIPHGEYAISVFHDEKSTGKMETNFMGFPKSGIGASGEFSKPPKFSKSKVQVSTESNSFVINVMYLGRSKP